MDATTHPSNAIDVNFEASCFQSDIDDYAPWLNVDLGATVEVEAVSVAIRASYGK